MAAVVLAPIVAGVLEDLPAFCLDLLIFVGLFLRLARPPAPRLLPSPAVAVPALALLLLGLLSLVSSVYPYATLAAWIHWSAWLTAAGLCAEAGRRPEGRQRVAGALLLGCGYVVVQGMQEYLYQAFREGNRSWRTFSTFFSPNLLAAYLEALIPLTLAVYLRAERRPATVLTGFLAALQIGTLFATGSRGGVLLLAGGMAAFAVMAAVRRVRPTRQDLARAVALLLVTLPLLAVTGRPILGRVQRSRADTAQASAGAATSDGASAPAEPAEAGAEAQSNQFRRLTWRSTLTMVKERPLQGFGLGAWRFVHPRFAIAGFTRMAHQSYLQLAAEIGVPGLLAFLALLAATVFSLLWAGPATPEEAWLVPGIGAGLAASAAHNLIDYSWYVYGTALPFWALVGLVWAFAQRGRETASPAPGRRELAAARVAATVWLAVTTWLAVAASYHARAAGAAALARQEASGSAGYALLEEAESLAQRAASLNPLAAEPWVLLGDIRRSRREFGAAVEAYGAAARRAPTWSIPRYRQGAALAGSGDLPGAIQAYEAGLRDDPHSTELLAHLAEAQIAAGRRADAHATYERLLGVAAGPSGQVTALEQMRDYRPALAHQYLGQEAEDRGHVGDAIAHYESGATLLHRRRRDLLAGGLATIEAAGQLDPAVERDLLQREQWLWERLRILHERRGHSAKAQWAREQAEDAAKHPLKLP